MGDDRYRIEDIRIGGRDNNYGDWDGRYSEPKPRKPKKQPRGYDYPYYAPPPSYPYPYGPPPPYQYPYPIPPWQYGGYDSYYGVDHGGYGQFPPPNQGGYYNYGRAASAAAGAPVYGYGKQHDTVANQLGHDHNHGGAAAGAAGNNGGHMAMGGASANAAAATTAVQA